eukprot:TRINITY_DN45438_c0_g1_i1.p1 TRINITY_DN45438_c0_g1~~TRINITY_DN45438_c0_g1_i1.p1  ORF type:complete len:394 (-),score=89.61 TRINITY_DN45438_c0_g1_i1:154-1335(-)
MEVISLSAAGDIDDDDAWVTTPETTGGAAKRALADITNEYVCGPRKVAATAAGPCPEGRFAASKLMSASFCYEQLKDATGDCGGADLDWERLLDRALQRLRVVSQSGTAALGRRCSSDGGILEDLVEDLNDEQQVSEYHTDIFSKLGRDEEDFCWVRPEYMEEQPELDAEERAVAVDWLVEVQVKYKLRTETLFLAVSLLDRFLSMRKVLRTDLQLVVVCAMFIAAKFEEIDAPDIRDFVHMTQQACSRQAILSMEVKMLTALEFALCRPTVMHFLDRFQRANGCSKTHRLLLEYFLQLALMDLKMTRYTPSQQVAAALLISSRLSQQPCTWPPPLGRQDQSEQHLKCVTHCALDMCRLLQDAERSPFQAVRKKFQRSEAHCVANLIAVVADT